ncbi:MAG: septum formation initiator family protein [Spirochaetales bacterium]|nr:septum formation initiator family protein [Spirochaetales bacterium]
MNKLNFYWPLLTALLFYSLFSFLWGSTGLNALQEMESRKAVLEKNLSELSSINEQLNEDLLSLSSDPERIAVQSRNLGYIQSNEKMLFANLSSLGSSQLDVGKILHLESMDRENGNLVKVITLLIFLTGQSFSILMNRKKRPAV